MVEPVTGGLIAGGLLSAAGGVLGAAADLHGLGAPRALRQLIDRFEAAPDETQVFYAAIWKAAVRATHGCVQQVYDHTATTDDVRGDTPSWDRFREAHARVRKVCEWSDAPTLPQALHDALTRDLAHTVRAQAERDDAGRSSAAQAVWAGYCIALREAGLQGEPPMVIRQAFFGERPEAKVWSWSRHFALRIGEQLRDDAGFKAMFDAAQFAWIGTGVARLVTEFTAVEQVLSEMSAKLDAVHQTVQSAEKNITQGQDKILAGQQRAHEDLSAKLDLLIASQSNEAALRQEIMQLRLCPDIRLEDLVGWLQAALHRSDPLPPDELPRLLQQALTIDLPKLRAEVERYRLDPLASPEAQALLDEVRALLHPQADTPLDLQAASDKLKVLDDRVVAERAARRRDEDHELAQLRVLRAEAERAMAHHAAAAELMEQAASLCHDDVQRRSWNQQSANDWFRDGELRPGESSLLSSVRLLQDIISSLDQGVDSSHLYVALGSAQARLGERLNGEAGLRELKSAEINYKKSLKVYTREAMPENWAITMGNLGVVWSRMGERLQGEAGLHALKLARKSLLAPIEIYQQNNEFAKLATTYNNLGNTQRLIGERLSGEAGLLALKEAKNYLHVALEIQKRIGLRVALATIHNNIGNVQYLIGERLDGKSGLKELQSAEASYNAALQDFPRNGMPVDWAMTKNNIGNVQRLTGERLAADLGVHVLREAISCYQEVLDVYTKEEMPVQWIAAKINLGAVLQRMGESLHGNEGLQNLLLAENCYREILQICTHDMMPIEWSLSKNNLGVVLYAVGLRLEDQERLQAFLEAEACCREALRVRKREAMPTAWATTQDILGNIKCEIGSLLDHDEGLQALQEAEAGYLAALEVRSRVALPLAWAKTQNNLGRVRFKIGQRLGGEASLDALRSAITNYRAALEIFTRETVPAYWNSVTNNLMLVEQLIAERGG